MLSEISYFRHITYVSSRVMSLLSLATTTRVAPSMQLNSSWRDGRPWWWVRPQKKFGSRDPPPIYFGSLNMFFIRKYGISVDKQRGLREDLQQQQQSKKNKLTKLPLRRLFFFKTCPGNQTCFVVDLVMVVLADYN